MRRAILGACLLMLTACGGPGDVQDTACEGNVMGITIRTDGVECASLAEDVAIAQAWGAKYWVWDQTQVWPGFTLHALKEAPLPQQVVGNPGHALGSTWKGAREIYVTTGLGRSAFQATLVHELIHATYGESDHCGWSLRYVPLFTADDDVGMFVDECQHVTCRNMGATYACE